MSGFSKNLITAVGLRKESKRSLSQSREITNYSMNRDHESGSRKDEKWSLLVCILGALSMISKSLVLCSPEAIFVLSLAERVFRLSISISSA